MPAQSSLVPRPSHPPVFNCLKCVKSKGKASSLGWLSVYLGTVGGRGPRSEERISNTRSSFQTWSSMFFTSWMLETPASTWGRNYTIWSQVCSFDGGTLPPPLSTKVDRDVIHVIKYIRPSHSIFAYCKQWKTGPWEGLGTRLRTIFVEW